MSVSLLAHEPQQRLESWLYVDDPAPPEREAPWKPFVGRLVPTYQTLFPGDANLSNNQQRLDFARGLPHGCAWLSPRIC